MLNMSFPLVTLLWTVMHRETITVNVCLYFRICLEKSYICCVPDNMYLLWHLTPVMHSYKPVYGTVIFRLICSGGWDTINDWLQDAKETENFPLLVEILKVYQLLPITVDILKTNNAAKTIKQLCKSDHESKSSLCVFCVYDLLACLFSKKRSSYFDR